MTCCESTIWTYGRTHPEFVFGRGKDVRQIVRNVSVYKCNGGQCDHRDGIPCAWMYEFKSPDGKLKTCLCNKAHIEVLRSNGVKV